MSKSRISRRKIRKKVPIKLSVKLPHKRVRERFWIIYELEGCQKAINYLTDYYGVCGMKIILNGKMVGRRKSNDCVACYENNRACFTKEGLEKKTILHELFHHLMESKKLEISLCKEERESNSYANQFLRV
jgi:hypothetical protein